MKNNIPVLYYHSIANHREKSDWSFLSTQIDTFKKQINFLHKNGYNTCTWDELYDHVSGIKILPKKTIKLHFDDGFLDNWSVIFPFMKEKNFKYSVLLTPDFIGKEKCIRDFVYETTDENASDWWGYLNLGEIKKMHQPGIVDFQAHGLTHTWYNASDKIIDIYDGENFYPHLIWNNPENDKSKWLQDFIKPKIGTPVFEYKKSLELDSMFKVHDSRIEKLTSMYDPKKDKIENIQAYNLYVESFPEFGTYESEDESAERLTQELKGAKDVLEELIGTPINYLVFPGGGKSKKTIEISRKSGYKLISQGKEPNAFNSKVYQISRYSAVYSFPKKYNAALNLLFLQLQLLRARDNYIINKIFKIIKYVKNI
jgi:peptidoglycan/xylan/chitin deacetylase (PgdA/CDA1 family)